MQIKYIWFLALSLIVFNVYSTDLFLDINLDVSTEQPKITVILPDGFNGPVEFIYGEGSDFLNSTNSWKILALGKTGEDVIELVDDTYPTNTVRFYAAINGTIDSDGDFLSDTIENIFGSNPNLPDSDFDEIMDYDEARYNLNPLEDDAQNSVSTTKTSFQYDELDQLYSAAVGFRYDETGNLREVLP